MYMYMFLRCHSNYVDKMVRIFEHNLIIFCLGLPQPIRESISVLRKHIYIPLADLQVEQEEKIQQQRR